MFTIKYQREIQIETIRMSEKLAIEPTLYMPPPTNRINIRIRRTLSLITDDNVSTGHHQIHMTVTRSIVQV